MRARDVMSRPVYPVRPDTPIEQAAALLDDHGFAAAPVVNGNGRLVGIVSEADLLRNRVPPDVTARLRRDVPAPAGDRPRLVSQVMTTAVIAMPPETDLAEVTEQLLGHQIRSLPIVERGEVVGIVSRRDILHSMVRTDDVLSMEVHHRLDQYAGGRHHWNVAVADGVVQVAGGFDDEVERQVVMVLARTVPGVVEARVMRVA